MNDYFAKILKQKQILKKNTIKEMLSRYRKMLTIVSKLNLKNIEIEMNVHFREEPECSIMVYSRKEGSNRTFYIYPFWSIEKNNAMFDTALSLIKMDDFSKIVEAKEKEYTTA